MNNAVIVMRIKKQHFIEANNLSQYLVMKLIQITEHVYCIISAPFLFPIC